MGGAEPQATQKTVWSVSLAGKSSKFPFPDDAVIPSPLPHAGLLIVSGSYFSFFSQTLGVVWNSLSLILPGLALSERGALG